MTTENRSTNSNLDSVIENLIDRIESENNRIDNRELIGLCRDYTQSLLAFDPHVYHEIAETSLNLLLERKYARSFAAENDPVKFVAETLKPLAARLPTQTWRSREQTIRQQFSTPPAIAFLLSYLVNKQDGETLLEPSAGTGSLLVWAGNQTFANEIDSRRRTMLRILGISATAFNAEFIDDYLPPEIRPDSLLMNPPFSANGGRTALNSSRYGFRHVESALQRLKKGGRFGIILGEAANLQTKTGNEFWCKMARRIEVKTIIKIDGREYYKNGTSVDVNIIIGTKRREEKTVDWSSERERIVSVSANSVEEAFGFASKLNLRLE